MFSNSLVVINQRLAGFLWSISTMILEIPKFFQTTFAFHNRLVLLAISVVLMVKNLVHSYV